MTAASARRGPDHVGVRVAGAPVVPVREDKGKAFELLAGQGPFQGSSAERGPEGAGLAILQDDGPVVDAGHVEEKRAALVLPSKSGPARALLAKGDHDRSIPDRVVDHVIVLHDPPGIGPSLPRDANAQDQVLVAHVGGPGHGPVLGVLERRQLGGELASAHPVRDSRATCRLRALPLGPRSAEWRRQDQQDACQGSQTAPTRLTFARSRNAYPPLPLPGARGRPAFPLTGEPSRLSIPPTLSAHTRGPAAPGQAAKRLARVGRLR